MFQSIRDGKRFNVIERPEDLVWHEGDIPSVHDVDPWTRILVWIGSCTIYEISITEGIKYPKRWTDCGEGFDFEEKPVRWAYICKIEDATIDMV